MKKGFTIIAVILLLVSFASAEVKTLIDFTLLAADSEGQNNRTKMDFSKIAGSSYTSEQKNIMNTSLAIENWNVILNSSARSTESQSVTMSKEAEVLSGKDAGKKIMGVRALFPVGAYNANITIKPPFEIPCFEMSTVSEDGTITESTDAGISGPTRFEDGYGVVKNVGLIKKISIDVLGRNFPHALYVLISNENMEQKKVYMGNLEFDGWKTLEWVNPHYVAEARNRELRLFPMYPQSTPFYKIDGLMVARDAAHVGGDFVGYFKDVKMIYDLAIPEREKDVDDEGLWGIIEARENVRKNNEIRRFGNAQVLRFMETQKMVSDDDEKSWEESKINNLDNASAQ